MHLRHAAALGAAALAAAASGCGEPSRTDPAPASAPAADAGAPARGAAPPSAARPDVAAPPPGREAGLRITYDAPSDRLDLVARDVPLAQVLAALVAETGIALEDQSGLDHAERVSPHLEGVALADAVHQLLEGQPKALGFDAGAPPGTTPRLASVLLLPPRSERAAAVVAAVRRGDEAAARALAASLGAPEHAEERALAVRELADATAEEPLALRTRAVHALLALDRGAAAR
ncbi:MAG TPA: hypothetical protein VFC77_12725, partial [Myxococcota bacterium]|nr:hypothetical protein [Myxococcota bacterium]